MDAVSQFLDRAQLLVQNHVPQEVSVPVMTATAIGLIVIGLGSAVLGAKLARGVLITSFVVMGLMAGVAVGHRVDAPEIVAGLVGAGIGGAMGYFLHRLWVGIAAGVLMSMLVTGTYGAYHLVPHLDAYEQSHGAIPAVTDGHFTTPDPQTQEARLNPQFTDWSKGFWNYVNEKAPQVTRNLEIITPALACLGVLMGLVAVRLTLVLMTSVAGIVLLTSGLAALVHQFRPELYETTMQHPEAIGAAFGVFLIGSLVLQTLLTRPAKAKAAPAASA